VIYSSSWIHRNFYSYDGLPDVVTESREGNDTRRNSAYDDKQILSETDLFFHKTLESIQDQEFCSLFQLPPEKVPWSIIILLCLRN
jgi:tRNA pseudouridine synthase 10